jgi:hypothetical protein
MSLRYFLPHIPSPAGKKGSGTIARQDGVEVGGASEYEGQALGPQLCRDPGATVVNTSG